MGNSKTLAVDRKHRKRQHAAKERVRAHLDGKLPADGLPALAARYLQRTLRLKKRKK